MPVAATSADAYERLGRSYNGVVEVSVGSDGGSGTLLYDGRAILSAAHLVSSGADLSDISVTLHDSGGREVERSVSKAVIHPLYEPRFSNFDLSVLWLSKPAGPDFTRHTLYRADDEIGQVAQIVGFGETGTGQIGAIPQTGGTRRVVENRVDTDRFTSEVAEVISFQTIPGEQLLIDFDSGVPTNDALGRFLGLKDLGLGADEGLIANGDSGGGLFIGASVAGVSSYIARLTPDGVDPDIDSDRNSSFGEIGGFQRVSSSQLWIDEQLRDEWADPPSQPEQVDSIVAEPDNGTVYAYFLVSFEGGERPSATDPISVDYRTFDGSARAGEDYIATAGTLNLYPGEAQAVIPVEVISDPFAEPSERFSLSIFNPVGAPLTGGAELLTATRTIEDSVVETLSIANLSSQMSEISETV